MCMLLSVASRILLQAPLPCCCLCPPPLPWQGMDLASELRRLLVGYNRAMGAEAT